jgi:cardiolipin synthase (CMP-forming)
VAAPKLGEPLLTLANQLTIARMALAPALVLLVLSGEHGWALAAFVAAGVTDGLDGVAARRGHGETTLGAMLDPVADKVLMGCSYVVLTWGRVPCPIPVWLTITILSRDAIILLSVAAINLTVGRRLFPPSWLGKSTTAAQIGTAGLVLLLDAIEVCPPWTRVVFWACLVLTVTSALHYVWAASRGAARS